MLFHSLIFAFGAAAGPWSLEEGVDADREGAPSRNVRTALRAPTLEASGSRVEDAVTQLSVTLRC